MTEELKLNNITLLGDTIYDAEGLPLLTVTSHYDPRVQLRVEGEAWDDHFGRVEDEVTAEAELQSARAAFIFEAVKAALGEEIVDIPTPEPEDEDEDEETETEDEGEDDIPTPEPEDEDESDEDED